MENLCYLFSALLFVIVLQCESLPTETTTLPIENATPTTETTTLPIENATPTLETTILPIENATPTIETTTLPIENATTTIETTTLPIENATPTIETTTLHIENATPTIETTTLPIENAKSMIQNRSCALTNYKVLSRWQKCTVDCVNGEERISCLYRECKSKPLRHFDSLKDFTEECDEHYQRFIYYHDIECTPGSFPASNNDKSCIVDCYLGFERSICSTSRCTPTTYIANNGQNCTVRCDGTFQNVTCSYIDYCPLGTYTQSGYDCYRYCDGGEYKYTCPKYQLELAANYSLSSVQQRKCALTNLKKYNSSGNSCFVDCVNGVEQITCYCNPYFKSEPEYNVTVECKKKLQREIVTFSSMHSVIDDKDPHCTWDFELEVVRKICEFEFCEPKTYIEKNGQNCTVTCKGTTLKIITCLYREECLRVNFTRNGYECYRFCDGGEYKYTCPKYKEELAANRSRSIISEQNRTCSLTNYKEYSFNPSRNCTVNCVDGEELISCPYNECTPQSYPKNWWGLTESTECGKHFSRKIRLHENACTPNNFSSSDFDCSDPSHCSVSCDLGVVREICLYRRCTPRNYIADNGQNCTVTCDGVFENITCLYRECATVNFTFDGYDCTRFCKGGELHYECPNSYFYFQVQSYAVVKVPLRERMALVVKEVEQNYQNLFLDYFDYVDD